MLPANAARTRLGWALVVLLLAGVGIGVHLELPPAPRWTISGEKRHGIITEDGKTLFTVPMDTPLQTWDVPTGCLRSSFADSISHQDNKSNLPVSLISGLSGDQDDCFPRAIFNWLPYARDYGLLPANLRYVPFLDKDGRQMTILDTQTGRDQTVVLPVKHKRTSIIAARAPSFSFGWQGRDRHPRDRPSLKYLIACDFDYPIHGRANQLHIIAASTGELLATLPSETGYGLPRFTPDDELLLYATREHDRLVPAIWSVKERGIVRTLPQVKQVKQVSNPICHGDSFLAAIQDGESGPWYFWDLRTGEYRFESRPGWWTDFSPDGRTIILWQDQTIELWDFDTWQIRATLRLDQPIRDLEFSPDGHWLAVYSRNMAHETTVYSLFNVQTGERMWENTELNHREVLRFSPDSQFLIYSGKWDEMTVVETRTAQFAGAAPSLRPARPANTWFGIFPVMTSQISWKNCWASGIPSQKPIPQMRSPWAGSPTAAKSPACSSRQPH